MPKKMLLADDSITIQRVVSITFANEDVAITTVDNGDDAIAKAKAIKPDIILADVIMPKKNGYEVCQAVRNDPELQHTPVLLLAGTFEAFDENRAREVGASGHITKPFESQALIDKVNELLGAAPAAAPRPAPQPVAVPRPAPAPASPQPGVSQAPPPPFAARPTGPQPLQPRPIGPTPQPLQPKPAPVQPLQPQPLQPRPVGPTPQPLQPKPAPVQPLQPQPQQPAPVTPQPLQFSTEPQPHPAPHPAAQSVFVPPPAPPSEPEPPATEPLAELEPQPGEDFQVDVFSTPAAASETPSIGNVPLAPESIKPLGEEEKPLFGDAPSFDTATPPGGIEAFQPLPEEKPPVLESSAFATPVEEARESAERLAADAALKMTEPEPAPEPLEPKETAEELPAVDIDEEGIEAEKEQQTIELAPAHEFIPPAEKISTEEVPTREIKAASVMTALSREEIMQLAREIIEKAVWEVVPQLAETILREEIDKLVEEKLKD
jgi:CheY-like chemotaxis protein